MAAAYTAAVKEGDRVLEPSAGVGGIAVAARSMGGDVTVNEISEKRAEGLRILGFDPTTEDAEQIANILEPESFDVVVMNPPFSAAGKRGVANSNTIGARHVSQAAKMLKPGGRLVTIMGEGFTPENARVRGLFSQMQKEGQFQAIVKMDGSKLYRKYGTTFDNQFIVWDKTGAPGDPAAIMRGEFDSIPDFLRAMEDIRNARPVAGDGVGAAIPPASGLGAELSGDLGVSGEGAVAGVAQGPGDRGPRDQPVDRRPAQPGVREGVGPGGVGTGVETAGPQERSGREPGGTGQRGGEQQRTQRVEQVAVAEQRIKEEEGTAFSAYQPSRVKVKGAQAHPAKLVESTAMASVKPPPTDYTPVIAQETVSEGRLSDAQLEQITFAGNAHAKKLPDDRRRGYFIGDGTGVGKGREIAGIMLDNWSQGRKRHVWVSKDKKLLKDAQRDVLGVGIEAELHDLTSIDTAHPGYLSSQDTFYVGTLKGVGRVYQQTYIDTYAKVALVKLYKTKTPITAADMLNDKVLPFYEQHALPVLRILTDRGTEYCGRADRHDYQLFLAINDIDHTKTKVKSPQTNGICERFHKTILQEFYQVTFRKKIYETIEQLQNDLDERIDHHNNERTHQGKICEGRPPMQTLEEGKAIWREKFVA